MFILRNKPLGLDTAFTHEGIQYPSNWLRMSSQEDRDALGITFEPDPEPHDDRFYWGPGNPKDLSQLKQEWISKVDTTAWNMLNPTDFMDSRKANDPDYEAPAAWLEWRASIRSTAKLTKIAIESAQTIEDLIPLVSPQWPSDPSQGGV